MMVVTTVSKRSLRVISELQLYSESFLRLTWDGNTFSWTVASPSERLHNLATEASRTLHAHCAHTVRTNHKSHISAPRHFLSIAK